MYVNLFDEKQKSVLELLSQKEIVKDFYLAGGTALALQYGHRESVDFDFFREENFSVDKVLEHFQHENVDIRTKQENTLLFLIKEISCSFFRYPYPLLYETLDCIGFIKLTSVADIAAMKVSAISTRGTKRDFVDLFFICKKDFSLAEVLDLFQKRFEMFNHEIYHIYKSLSYFGDAEGDDMPKMYEEVDWREIKTFFKEEVSKLIEK